MYNMYIFVVENVKVIYLNWLCKQTKDILHIINSALMFYLNILLMKIRKCK